ncbi:hypothetical protein ACH4U3_34395 [Streptomyces griseoruber]|uniref:hypothetical protein n=1 Tax=Streptomyces griseoruber TaxID=1943 RepID=UPI00379FEADE
MLDDVVGKVVLLVLGCDVLFGMLEASRLKWVGEVRTSEEAVPPDDAELLRPGDYSLRHDLVDEGFLLVMLGPAPAPLPGTPGVTLHTLSCTWKKWHPVAA